MKLSIEEKQFIIQKIAAGEVLPDDFQEKLFPTLQKEYELRYAGKMRREDLLADQDGTFAVPLQTEKIFNGEREIFDDGWKNLIVFGDNLQFLKTVYADKDELIKGKVKGKVKLIYIDPPFGTGDDYDGNNGQKAYSAKTKGADFVEFVRRRLIVAKEILAPDGAIFIRLDYHFGHYAKIVMDEVFGKENFQNEFVVNRVKKNVTDKGKRTIPNAVDNVYVYFKSPKSHYVDILKKLSIGKKGYWHSMDSPGVSGPRQAIIHGETYYPPTGTHFKYTQVQVDDKVANGKIRVNPNTKKPQYWVEAKEEVSLDSNWTDIPGYTFTQNYPTENSEQLLDRIIRAASYPGDIIMDFFGGSGTTIAVAEKLGRKWITCDIGKLSLYTMQKRLLRINNSKSLVGGKEKYGKAAKSFITVNTGLYDIEKLRTLEKEKYIAFVLGLFEVENKIHKINGVKLHGYRKDAYSVLVWDYMQEDGTKVDEIYLENLHRNIGKRIGARLYIIAPANAVQFIGDFYEIDDVRYYFLKIPYQIINELHKEPFSKLRQPQSKSKINDLENAVGFHFMRQPDVNSKFENGILTITKFRPHISDEQTGKSFENFETLSMLIWDAFYDGQEFNMTDYKFADDLVHINTDTTETEHTDEEIQEELKSKTQIALPIREHGNSLFLIYIDIFGNEFKEEIKITDDSKQNL
jgi:adenine-specific DNA-methyltransferase